MLRRAMVVWVLGLVTVVPYATWYLLFHAPRSQYAVLITLVLFWIFGYWGIVGPLLGAIKVRKVFRAIEQARSSEDLLKTLQSTEAREAAIEFIAMENHIPKFLATRVYDLLVKRLSMRSAPRTSTIHASKR